MDIVFSPTELGIMRQIKQVFDPNGILNPGKIFPDTK
jgi:glycolate oxidase